MKAAKVCAFLLISSLFLIAPDAYGSEKKAAYKPKAKHGRGLTKEDRQTELRKKLAVPARSARAQASNA